MHRRAILIADKFFQDAPSYVLGDAALIERIAATWQPLSAALDLPEFEPALTASQYIEILIARNKRGG